MNGGGILTMTLRNTSGNHSVTLDKIMGVKRFFEYSTSFTLHQGSENLKIPTIGSKFKFMLQTYGVTYQNLCKKGTKPIEKN